MSGLVDKSQASRRVAHQYNTLPHSLPPSLTCTYRDIGDLSARRAGVDLHGLEHLSSDDDGLPHAATPADHHLLHVRHIGLVDLHLEEGEEGRKKEG